jgi:hypothetical protein
MKILYTPSIKLIMNSIYFSLFIIEYDNHLHGSSQPLNTNNYCQASHIYRKALTVLDYIQVLDYTWQWAFPRQENMTSQFIVMLQEFVSWDTRLWGRLEASNIYCASTEPADSCPKANPREQRGLTLYTIPSRLQKQKAKLNPHMAAHDFIGYFIPPVLCELHVSIL